MTKIKPSTSLAELAVVFGKLGVRDCNLGIAPGHVRVYRAQICTRDHIVTGEGNELAHAIDDGVSRLEHLLGEKVSAS